MRVFRRFFQIQSLAFPIADDRVHCSWLCCVFPETVLYGGRVHVQCLDNLHGRGAFRTRRMTSFQCRNSSFQASPLSLVLLANEFRSPAILHMGEQAAIIYLQCSGFERLCQISVPLVAVF
ncbi:hypothetical protein AVEN_132861-1 [Araneus ventricosus]|uniref:Uncharacterized protein n=1 Tax=Araneus ventricosus TaxID=182803 RepID=A0A4Y2GTC0_ARAVE|nr:hypothetical protein AVEN_132861-1 [Araneus ventricosus]